jgi:uncharacterized membrane protein YhaH (DUF805 family)
MDFVNIFITFGQRISRAKFWTAILVYVAVGLVFVALTYLGSGSTTVQRIVGILVIMSSASVCAKRLHDRNKSGWYVLLFLVAPLSLFAAGVAIGTMSGGSDTVATALWLIAAVISIWAFIELGCLRGTIGRNQYGPDPLAPEVLTPPVRTHA